MATVAVEATLLTSIETSLKFLEAMQFIQVQGVRSTSL